MTRTEAEREMAAMLRWQDMRLIEDEEDGYCTIMATDLLTGHPIMYEPSMGYFVETIVDKAPEG